MKEVSNISQLAAQNSSASSLTNRLPLSSNGTQPSPAAGPSAPGLSNVASAVMFAASLGSQETNSASARAISDRISAGSDFLRTAGSLIAPSGSRSLADTSEYLSTFANNTYGQKNKINSDVLAEVSNSSRDIGASVLGSDSFNLTQISLDPYKPVTSDWVFICAPQDVEWTKTGDTKVLDGFGTNDPYVTYSSTGKRVLSLTNVLIEGFSAGKEIEDHIIKLESMMNMEMNTQAGYVSPYCWDLRAGDKSYGMFLIQRIKIKETMRNKKGRADRAFVDIDLIEVPSFQINDGRDLATSADLASGSTIVAPTKTKSAAAKGTPRSKSPGAKVTPQNVPPSKPGSVLPDKSPPPVNLDTL